MRNLLVFAFLIGGPLFYLSEHACSFRLHQDIAQLQEQRQRMNEVCDSLSACIGSLNSCHRIEAEAIALGMKPKITRQALLVPQALAAGAKKASTLESAAGRKPGSAQKKGTGSRAGTTAAGKTSGNSQKPVAGRF